MLCPEILSRCNNELRSHSIRELNRKKLGIRLLFIPRAQA